MAEYPITVIASNGSLSRVTVVRTTIEGGVSTGPNIVMFDSGDLAYVPGTHRYHYAVRAPSFDEGGGEE